MLFHWRRFREWLVRATAPLLRRGARTKTLGLAGEDLAEQHLVAQGFRILHRQYRSHWGEIDLIAEDGEWVVFVEVKTRRSTAAGHPVEAVHARKQEKLTRLALAWMKQHRSLDHRARFDVVAVLWPADGSPPQITHYRHAFEARIR